MYRVKILDSREFRQVEKSWNSLVTAMDNPSIFCTWDWIYTWWEHFGDAYEPVILSIYKDSELRGILPLARLKLPSRKNMLEGRVLCYCGSRELYPDHLDIISRKKDARHCIQAAFDFLGSEYRDWDVLEIALLSEESSLISSHGEDVAGFDADVTRGSSSPFIQLSRGVEKYQKEISGSIKNIVRRKQKKLHELGIKYSANRAMSGRESLDTLFRLHEMRARKKGIESTFSGKALFDFHDSLISRISAKGWLWLRFLGNEEKIISAIYCFAFCGRLLYYQMGLDPEWEVYSPGTVLMHEVIKEAFSGGIKEFDFLRGDEGFKKGWTKDARWLYSMRVYNKTLHSNFSKKALRSKNLIKKTIKRLIS